MTYFLAVNENNSEYNKLDQAGSESGPRQLRINDQGCSDFRIFLNIHIFRTYCKNTPDYSTILCLANVEGLKRFQNHTILYSQTFRAASFHMLSLKPFYHFLTSLSGVPLTLPSISNLKPSRYFIPKQFRCILKLIWEHCD